MATERLSMTKTREILRKKWVLKLSYREIGLSVGAAPSGVWQAIKRAEAAGLDWAAVEKLDDGELNARLYAKEPSAGRQREMPDCAWIDTERRRVGVTLELLHLEYLEKQPDGYRYTQFCEIYRQWLSRQRLSMRQVYRGGEKLFVDYSGKRPCIWDPTTGERIVVELFVAALGASNFTYAEASMTQRSRDWIASHVRTFEYMGGAAGLLVPDQLRSGVSKTGWYEPGTQKTYDEMARHYDTAVLPARPRKPRDKAKVEVAVQIAQRWILARLRNERHFSLDSLNVRIAELLEDLNDRMMRRYGETRRQLFERLDRPALKPLPAGRFVYGDWKNAGVNIDYHVDIEHHYYSVPFQLANERGVRVDVRYTASTVEIFQGARRVASHARSYVRGGYTTNPEHMPKSHRDHAEWTPTRMIRWAGTVGPKTAELVTALLEERPHPEQGYRACLGILRLERRYGGARLEAACARAVILRARTVESIDSTLRKGLDRLPLPTGIVDPPPARPNVIHENVRGRDYYDNNCTKGTHDAQRTNDREIEGTAAGRDGVGLD
jgi:transposase